MFVQSCSNLQFVLKCQSLGWNNIYFMWFLTTAPGTASTPQAFLSALQKTQNFQHLRLRYFYFDKFIAILIVDAPNTLKDWETLSSKLTYQSLYNLNWNWPKKSWLNKLGTFIVEFFSHVMLDRNLNIGSQQSITSVTILN